MGMLKRNTKYFRKFTKKVPEFTRKQVRITTFDLEFIFSFGLFFQPRIRKMSAVFPIDLDCWRLKTLFFFI